MIKKCAVICHDAGGAEILSSYVNKYPGDYVYSLEGPAIKIFEKKVKYLQIQNIESVVKSCDWILCGTSWQSNLEYDAFILGKKNNKKTVAFIDHWVNYSSRFIRNGKKVLPDEIWVGDDSGYKIATEEFSNTFIKQVENPYFLEIKNLISNSGDVTREEKYIKVLFVSEPISEHGELRHGNSRHLGYTEKEAFTYFLKNKNFVVSNIGSIVIRPHPAEDVSKYNSFVSNGECSIKIGGKKKLIDEILESDIVVGCSSMAMVIALMANKSVISIIPEHGDELKLPQKEIVRLHAIVNYCRNI
jgi:hypothetical protein